MSPDRLIAKLSDNLVSYDLVSDDFCDHLKFVFQTNFQTIYQTKQPVTCLKVCLKVCLKITVTVLSFRLLKLVV
jgi:hypothetical protein